MIEVLSGLCLALAASGGLVFAVIIAAWATAWAIEQVVELYMEEDDG
jgi:hypothetical protein